MSLFHLLKRSNYLLGTPSTARARAFRVSRVRFVHYANANRDTFDKITSQSDRIAVVDFYADWCGPCKTLTPVLEKLTAEPSKTKAGLPLDLVKVDIDTDDGRELAGQFKVTAVPTVIAFKDAVALALFRGAMSPASVKDFLDKLE